MIMMIIFDFLKALLAVEPQRVNYCSLKKFLAAIEKNSCSGVEILCGVYTSEQLNGSKYYLDVYSIVRAEKLCYRIYMPDCFGVEPVGARDQQIALMKCLLFVGRLTDELKRRFKKIQFVVKGDQVAREMPQGGFSGIQKETIDIDAILSSVIDEINRI